MAVVAALGASALGCFGGGLVIKKLISHSKDT
jgi:hypothetical protein